MRQRIDQPHARGIAEQFEDVDDGIDSRCTEQARLHGSQGTRITSNAASRTRRRGSRGLVDQWVWTRRVMTY